MSAKKTDDDRDGPDLSKQSVVNLRVKPEAAEILRGIRNDTGVPGSEALVRILEWFASLDRKFRLALLNKDDETRRELALRTLLDMAKRDPRALITDLPMAQSVQMLEALQRHIQILSDSVNFQVQSKNKK